MNRVCHNIRCKKYIEPCLIALLGIVMTFGCFMLMGISNILQWDTAGKDMLIGVAMLMVMQLWERNPIRWAFWRIPCVHYMGILGFFSYILVQVGQVSYESIHPYYLWALYGAVLFASLMQLAGDVPKARYICGGIVLVGLVLDGIGIGAVSGFYALYGDVLHVDNVLPILQTNPAEATEFFIDRIGAFSCVAVVVFIIVIAYVLLRVYGSSMRSAYIEKVSCISIIGCLFFSLGTGVLLYRYIPKCMPYRQVIDAVSHIRYVRAAGAKHDENLKQFHLLQAEKQTLAQALPGSVIVIVGESEARDHMKAFSPDYEVETTPWLSQMKSQETFFLFDKAYANFPVTVPSLSMYLYGGNQYNHKGIDEVVNIMDVARAAGYTTWWVSNQTRLSGTDSVIDFVAANADRELRTAKEGGDDAQILDVLKGIPANQSNFIIIHMMGSHIRYRDRLPEGYQGISYVNHDQRTNTYDSTVLYTDQLLQDIWAYGKEHFNLQVMTYCSDHGENMEHSHVSSRNMTWDMVRIPFFVYLSPAYEGMYPEVAQNLSRHKDDVFTNDLMFDTISGLIQAPNTDYEASYDISSSVYDLPVDKAVTKHGEWKVADDPDLC